MDKLRSGRLAEAQRIQRRQLDFFMTIPLTIAVCTYERAELLRRCLASLRPQLDAQSELLVVDSAPVTSATRTVAGDLHYVTTPRPGLNIARNLALSYARGDIIAFIDDDGVADSGWLASLRAAFADPTVDCVTGRVPPLELRTPAQHYFEEHFSFDRGPKPIRFEAADDRPWFPLYPAHLGTGCNMAFRRHVFDRIGPFDEALDAGTPTGGGGDLDIFRRLLRAGFVAVYQPEAIVYHQHRAEAAASRTQFLAYGRAFTAVLTKILLFERELTAEATRLFVYRFWQQARWLARKLATGRGLPVYLILLETWGHVLGPLAYIRSLRRIQRERLLFIPPAQVASLDLDRDITTPLAVREKGAFYLVFKQGQTPRGCYLLENPGPSLSPHRLSGLARTLLPAVASGEPARTSSILPRVSVIICTRNRPDQLQTCLDSLAGIVAEGQPEIIVVDNGSDPETGRVAANYAVRVVPERHEGLCRARNRGLAEARGEVVAYLDDDTVVDKGWFQALTAAFADPDVAGVVGLVLPLELRTPAQRIFESLGGLGRGFDRHRYQGQPASLPVGHLGVGANMAFRRQALLRHGPFDEALDLGTPSQSGGDIDIFYWLLKGGETILYEPAVLVWHKHRAELAALSMSRYRYSMGAAAAFFKWLLRGDLAVIKMGLRWLVNHHSRELATALVGKHLLPPRMVAAGIYGACMGPLAYIRARWRIRHIESIEMAFWPENRSSDLLMPGTGRTVFSEGGETRR